MSNYNLRIDDLTGNSKFENLKLLISLIKSYVKLSNSIYLTVNLINETITYEQYNIISINMIRFQFHDLSWKFEFEEELPQPKVSEIIVNTNSNIQKQISKIFSKFENKNFLLTLMTTLEKEILR